VPLIADSPEEAVRTFQRRLNRVLNKVLTRYRLETLASSTDVLLSFMARHDEPVAIRLRKPWHLYIGHKVQAVQIGRRQFELKTSGYEYRFQTSPWISDEAAVRFEYVGQAKDPDFPYCRNHVQLHKRYHDVLPGFSPSKLHLPTGWVTIESVIRFAITDLRVRPLSDGWRETLAESEGQFRDWTQTA
jgi:hypothetical protein